MIDISDELRALVDKLDEQGIDYALCGGMAMAVHDRPRFTIDIDLLIQKESLAAAMAIAESLAYNIHGKDLSLAGGSIEIRRISKIDPDGGDLLTVDFLLVTPQIREAWDSRIESEWMGGRLWVVSREGLVILKRLSGRPQDLVDIGTLTEEENDERPDMSPQAVTARLKRLSQLRRLGLSLKKAKIKTEAKLDEAHPLARSGKSK